MRFRDVGNGPNSLDPKIDNQNISFISTVPILVNLYKGKLFKRN